MDLLNMRGAYGGLEAWLYATVVAGGLAPLSFSVLRGHKPLAAA